jgi:two-component system, sensor histidine kinase and response regulator
VEPPLVLVADDSASVRAVVRRALEAKGCAVQEVEDGLKVFEALAERRPDVVLLDVEMPGLDGFSVLDRMRGDPELDNIPVILLTGRTERESLVSALERGAHDYLTKPFEPEEVAARVRAALRTVTLLQELHRRNSELDLFAAKAAHDLKSPLTVIKGGADVLQHGWDRLTEDVRNGQLAAISRAASRAATMVDKLLALARLDTHRSAHPGATEPHSRIAGLVAATDLPDGDQTVIAGEWAPVAVPEADIDAAMTNLVENARHYGRCPDGTLALEITGRIDGSTLIVDVRDHGPGIRAEDRDQVFDAFYAGKGSREINPTSSGVGLAIVKRGVQRWGGHVSVVDGADEGARFRLVLPLAD